MVLNAGDTYRGVVSLLKDSQCVRRQAGKRRINYNSTSCRRHEPSTGRVSSFFFSSKHLRLLTIKFKSREVVSLSVGSQFILESFDRKSRVYGHSQAVLNNNHL